MTQIIASDSLRFSHFSSLDRIASIAVPVLVKLLNDPDALVRRSAANALKAIDPEAAAKAGVK